MGKVFQWIGNIIAKRPVKIFFVTTLIFIIMIAGAVNVRMATGNDTLVETDTDAYQSNLKMEEDFGGDSIIVLFESQNKEDLLSIDNMEKMWNVQQEMKYEDNLFSLMSPASIVNNMTVKQGDTIKEKVIEISDGLQEMSEKMTELGTELNQKEIKDPKEIENKINDLSNATAAFDKLIQGQLNMAEGTEQLQGKMVELAGGLDQVSLQLNQLSQTAASNPQMAKQLEMLSQKLTQSANGLGTMANKTTDLQTGSKNTANGLEKMKNNLQSQTNEMKGGFDGALTPDQLKEMSDGFLEMGEKLADISEGLETFYDKSGMMEATIPSEQAQLDEILYDEEGNLRSLFSDVVVNEQQALMIVKLNGNLADTEKDAVYQKLNHSLEKQNFETVSYMVSGKPVLDSALRSDMKDNMKSMIGLAVALMLVILMVIFKVRWRVLPLVTVFIAVVGTLGLMGSVGIPMTMVSMAVFPILIGLGIDYSIQFHNRYEEEKSMKTTLRQMGPAVATAVFATVLSFIALYKSPVPMVQDFGKMLTIGVIVSYFAGIFILMTILYIRDTFFPNTNKRVMKKVEIEKESWLEKGLGKMTKVILKLSAFILILSLLATGWGIYADGKVGVQTDIETFMPQDTQELKNLHKLRDVLGSTDQVVLYLEDENILSQENLEWMDRKTNELAEKYPDIVVDTKSITSLVNKINDTETLNYQEAVETLNDIPLSQRKVFVNEENNKAVILVNIKHVPVEEVESFVSQLKKDIKGTEMQVKVTGKSVLDIEMIKGLTSGRVEMTFLGMGLLFIGLLFVYRNPIKAFIPVFPISLIVGLSGGIMYLMDIKYTPLTATLGALILGIGTEMTILLLERYMEERKLGKDKVEAMQTAVSKIGVAIIASGITTIGGFSVLMISDFVILQDFGLMTLINLSLALFSTLVILPPVIVWLDRWIVGRKEVTKSIPVTE